MKEIILKIEDKLVIPLKKEDVTRKSPEEIVQAIIKLFEKIMKVFLMVVKDGSVVFENVNLKCPKCGRDEIESNIMGSGKLFGVFQVNVYLKILLDETCGLYYWKFSFKK